MMEDIISIASTEGTNEFENVDELSEPSFLFEPIHIDFEVADNLRQNDGVAPAHPPNEVIVIDLANNSLIHSDSSQSHSFKEDEEEKHANNAPNISNNDREKAGECTNETMKKPPVNDSSSMGDNSIMAMETIVKSNNSPTQIATMAFIHRMGMVIADKIEVIGSIVDVCPNGNCGLYSLILGLYHLHIDPFYLTRATCGERRRQLLSRLRNVYSTRRELYFYLHGHVEHFNSRESYVRRVHDATGEQLRDFAAPSEQILQRPGFIGRRMFKPAVYYNRGCNSNSWMDVNWHLPIAAMTYKVTILCYFKTNGTGRHNTTIAHYNDENVNMYFIEGAFYTPPTDTPVICLNYINDCHFQYIRLHSYDGPRFDWDDLDFDSFETDYSSDDDDDDSSHSTSNTGGDINESNDGDKRDDDDDDSNDEDSCVSISTFNKDAIEDSDDGDKHDSSSNTEDSLDDFIADNDVGSTKIVNCSRSNIKESSVSKSNVTSQYENAPDHPADHSNLLSKEANDSTIDAENRIQTLFLSSSSHDSHNDVCDYVGRRPKIERYNHFDGHLVCNNKKFVRYKGFNQKSFTVRVPSADLANKIIVQHDGKNIVKAAFARDFNRAAWFRSRIQKAPKFPSHINLVTKNSVVVTMSKSGAGKRCHGHNFKLKWSGRCSEGRHNPGCSTKWIGGVTEANLLSFALDPFDSMVELEIVITGNCIHRWGKTFGQLRGEERQVALDEVRIFHLCTTCIFSQHHPYLFSKSSGCSK